MKSRWKSCPIISSAVQPNIFSEAALQNVTVPLSSSMIMASTATSASLYIRSSLSSKESSACLRPVMSIRASRHSSPEAVPMAYLHDARKIPLIQERHFARFLALAGKDRIEEGDEVGTIFPGNELPETPADQPGAFDAQKFGAAEVHGTDARFTVYGKVADRSEIIEVGVLLQSLLHLVPGLAELGILHLQLDPVDLKFMDEPLHLLPGYGLMLSHRFRRQSLFGLATQFSC